MIIKYTEEQLNTIDKSLLIQMCLNLQEEIIRSNNNIDLLTKEIQSLNENMDTMMAQLVLSNKAHFGRSSKKANDPAQLSFIKVDGSFTNVK
ncbi:MAG: hypothetical protein Q4B86_07660 [Eubacteriales bacterium]|nr:hypothetical protein [Eubacteriales bacterium]